MSKRILALDPAQKCGWAHSNSDGHHGVWFLAGEIGRQHADLEQRLTNAIAAWGCDLIATENAGFGSRNPNVQAMHNERLGVIRLVAARRGVEVKTFQPNTIKLFATGNGHADKSQMVAALKRLMGVTVASDDEADACWILELAKRPECWPEPKAKVSRSRGKSRPRS